MSREAFSWSRVSETILGNILTCGLLVVIATRCQLNTTQEIRLNGTIERSYNLLLKL